MATYTGGFTSQYAPSNIGQGTRSKYQTPTPPAGGFTSQYAPPPTTYGGSQGSSVSQAASTAKQNNANYSVDEAGNTIFSGIAPGESMADREALMRLQAQLQADAEGRRFGMFRSIGPGSSPYVQHGAIGSDEAAARAAAFARAKDQAGKIASSSLRGLQEAMSARGLTGSGIDALQQAGVIQSAANPLQELTRDQLMQDLNRAADIADLSYQGAITQRGQDLSTVPSMIGLMNAISSRSLY